jgi:hypothetical protein
MSEGYELTPEQQAQVEPHMRKWLEIGIRTGTADWATWQSGAKRCYGFSKLEWPNVIVQVPSPLAGAVISGSLSHLYDSGVKLDEKIPPGSTLKAWRIGEKVIFRVIQPGETEGPAPKGGELVATGVTVAP